MKLHELLKEYGESMPATEMPSFEDLCRREKQRHARRWMALAGLAAAACLVAAIVLRPEAQPARQLATLPASQAPAPVLVTRSEPEQPLRATDGVRRKTVSRPVVRVREETGFVALAGSSMLPEPAMFQVLRVSISGTRLAALGVVRPDQLVSSTMTADVLVGDDGMARAVRVVANE